MEQKRDYQKVQLISCWTRQASFVLGNNTIKQFSFSFCSVSRCIWDLERVDQVSPPKKVTTTIRYGQQKRERAHFDAFYGVKNPGKLSFNVSSHKAKRLVICQDLFQKSKGEKSVISRRILEHFTSYICFIEAQWLAIVKPHSKKMDRTKKSVQLTTSLCQRRPHQMGTHMREWGIRKKNLVRKSKKKRKRPFFAQHL